ncbi:MAG: DUF6273 domain-containing protein [Bacilli bacterium]
MSNNKKRNIIIGVLCAIVLLMAVGYAAFNTVLNIKGTSNITSSWNIKITKIETKNIVGTASNNGDPSFEELSATFKTILQAPGDSIEYDITVSNAGSLDAKLDEITLSDTNNPAIKFTASGMTKGDVITAGNTKVLTVKVEYISSVSEQPTNTTSSLTVDLDYSQATGTAPSGESAADKLIGTAVTTGDGLYADTYEEGRYIYRGGTPNNYIIFNGETWRILSVEADGTIKVIRNESIGDKAFDSLGYRDKPSNGTGGTYCAGSSLGCNAWAKNDSFVNGSLTGTVLKDAELNTYLNNDYYNELTEEAKEQITTGAYKIGPVVITDKNLSNTVNDESNITWNGKIALATASEYVRTSNNSVCTSVNAYVSTSSCYNNGSTHNWLTKIMNSSTNKYSWLLSPDSGRSNLVFIVYSAGDLSNGSASDTAPGVAPVVYLKSDIQLSGEGTEDNPYIIG